MTRKVRNTQVGEKYYATAKMICPCLIEEGEGIWNRFLRDMEKRNVMNKEGKIVEDSDVLKPNPEMVFRKEETGAFLFDPQSGNLKYINETGVRIFEFCHGGKTLADIVTIMKADYPDTDPEKITVDAKTFLEELTKMHFLQLCVDNESR